MQERVEIYKVLHDSGKLKSSKLINSGLYLLQYPSTDEGGSTPEKGF